MMILSKEVKTRREYSGLSQRELATLAGVPRSTIDRIERNVVKTPSNETLYKIFEALADEDYEGA